MRLFVMRHGFAYHNLAALKIGEKAYTNIKYKDAELTPFGVTQTINTGKKLSDVNFKRIYCSPSLRCIQTCMNILKENNYYNSIIILDDRLLEKQGYHICNERKTKIELEKYLLQNYNSKFDLSNVSLNYEFNKENTHKIKQRINNFIYDLSDKFSNDDDILIVTHYVWLYNFYEIKKGYPHEFENAEVKIVYL